MLKWLLLAWVLVPGGIWVLLCAMFQRWYRRPAHRRAFDRVAERSVQPWLEYPQAVSENRGQVFFHNRWIN